MPSAFDTPDVQVGVEPDIFLSKASLPADCFQPIHYLFHQNLITPLPFHNANFRNYALNFYYTLVAQRLKRHLQACSCRKHNEYKSIQATFRPF